jgi:hypothetical protein
MLIIRYRWKGKCPKHPRYDPRKHGEGGIKAGCATCYALLAVYARLRKVMEGAALFEEITRPTVPPATVQSAFREAAKVISNRSIAFGQKSA